MKIKKKDRQFLITSFFFIVLDVISKCFVRLNLELGYSNQIIPGILNFTYLQNTGAAFGMFKDMNAIFLWLSVFVLGYFFYSYDDLPKPYFADMLILAGIMGNLLDRIFLGYVVDFIDFVFWPVFNFADSYLCIGVFLIVLDQVKSSLKKINLNDHLIK